jgi:hypothetical protein
MQNEGLSTGYTFGYPLDAFSFSTFPYPLQHLKRIRDVEKGHGKRCRDEQRRKENDV